MPLKKFKFHSKPDVRLVTMNNTVFKIKLTCQKSSVSKNIRSLCKATNCQLELKKAVCAILYTDKQEPILTESFVIYPYKKEWETAKKLSFEHKGQALQVNNSMYTLYIEPRKNTNQDKAKANNPDPVISRKRKFIETQHPCFEKSDSAMPFEDSEVTVKMPTVSEYGQKNRHDIESQNIKEQLRMQEMARPLQKTEELPKATGFFNCVKRLLGR